MSENDEIDFGGHIQVKQIDELMNSSIEISCYREISRLERMLTVFRKAMSLAHDAGEHEALNASLKKLHDCKGQLTATWSSAVECMRLRRYVEAAWQDECEWEVIHQTMHEREIVRTTI